jgi:hypothetical protein
LGGEVNEDSSADAGPYNANIEGARRTNKVSADDPDGADALASRFCAGPTWLARDRRDGPGPKTFAEAGIRVAFNIAAAQLGEIQ